MAASTSDAQPVVLDVSGLNCPMPLLKAKKALNGVGRRAARHRLCVRAISVFSRQSGNTLLESTRHDGRYEYLLRKKSG
jgi:tRNA 2-thiouridine synthesizing protein A